MCGICGLIDFNGKQNHEKIKNMMDSMVHRGPDGHDIYSSPGLKPTVLLGHRRLSIIDLSSCGKQPMSNEDKTIWLTLNGEIYNYKTLRTALEEKGHVFKSHTDSEVVIHLYEEYGEDCLKHMRGMFAFAIWDEKRKILLIARDRAGQKPVLYYHGQGRFCFASEFAALLKSEFFKKEINFEAIHYYLTFGYIPAPLTIYKNVFKLLPAHMLILKDDKVTIKQYWELNYSNKIKISEEDASSEILRLLKNAVALRLHSDVPLGAFLSGGIDSSTIVALMSELSSSKVKTFSIGFNDRNYDELKYASAIAKKFGTEHNEFIVKPDALNILPLLVERYGEPHADSSCIPTYYVSCQTKRYVTVALNGDGGDEFFAGYDRYQAMALSEIYNKIPLFLRSAIKGAVGMLPNSADSRNVLRRTMRFLEGASLKREKRYLWWISVFNEEMKRKIYSQNFSNKFIKKDSTTWITNYINDPMVSSSLDRVLMTDAHTYLPNDLLVKADMATMACSLETRSPFLDHKLMDFAASLPSEYKMKRFIKKYILKKAIKDIVPPANIHRKKMGFGVPIGKWFRNELKDFVRDILLSKKSVERGYFKAEYLEKMVNDHISGKGNYAAQLWALLMLELWHKKFID